MTYLLIIIPVFILFVFFLFKRKQLNEFVWWEYGIYFLSNVLIIMLVRYLFSLGSTTDIQYYNGYVTHARYYEYYSTWVDQTCTETYACGTTCNSDGTNCQTQYCTRTYDCSYCDETNPYWMVYDNRGNSYSITQSQYNKLIQLWANVKFVELNRKINKYGSCGVDGNAYDTYWNNDPLTCKLTVQAKSYENKILSNAELTSYIDVSKEEIKKYNLFDYPELTDMDYGNGYSDKFYQRSVMGMEKCGFSVKDIMLQLQYIDYLNAIYGEKYKIKVFVLFYNSTSTENAILQEAYWQGGNQNELVICVGANNGKINWVKPFSATYNRKILVDMREDIINTDYDPKTFASIIEKHIPNFIVRNYKEDFNYVVYEETTACIITISILCTILSCILIFVFISNKHKNI